MSKRIKSWSKKEMNSRFDRIYHTIETKLIKTNTHNRNSR